LLAVIARLAVMARLAVIARLAVTARLAVIARLAVMARLAVIARLAVKVRLAVSSFPAAAGLAGLADFTVDFAAGLLLISDFLVIAIFFSPKGLILISFYALP
jgi:hypothetical protein